MKRDIDGLMKERNIDVAIIEGAVKGNATMFYMVNGAKISHATVIKKRGEDPVLICGTMEREEAAESGLETVDSSKYNYIELLKASDGDRLKAQVAYYAKIFEEFGVKGRVAFYGQVNVSAWWVFLGALQKAMPGIEIVGEFSENLFIKARATKEPYEVDRIRDMGRRTCEVVQHIIDFIKSHRVEGETFVKADGTPLLLGDCKTEIRMALTERNMVEEVGTIFALGRDAGIPHSRGKESDPMMTGKTLVFDIFPQEEGAGYFFDMTRTFVFGEASPEILNAYAQLSEIHDKVTSALTMGEKAGVYQTMVCDFMEANGHETPRTNPQVTDGYTHSLGHGIGLDIHESPRLWDGPGSVDVLEPGHVFTVEPGIYYPSKGWGMRIEDVYYVHDDGTMENLTNFPRDLIVKL